ncbi:hypothetical protein HMI54_001625 [Coelomomyces lativittatus]|nr:hypothetical protein HMI55_001445 [Coelomomyces lativittatus]KAJ1510395.1 hypothetical protein HMI54_001625 [Coelomomyces lativittatus]
MEFPKKKKKKKNEIKRGSGRNSPKKLFKQKTMMRERRERKESLQFNPEKGKRRVPPFSFLLSTKINKKYWGWFFFFVLLSFLMYESVVGFKFPFHSLSLPKHRTHHTYITYTHHPTQHTHTTHTHTTHTHTTHTVSLTLFSL